MSLDCPEVRGIVDHVARTGTSHLGIVPDFGVFGTRPSEVLLAWFQRRGASADACEASVELASMLGSGEANFKTVNYATRTAGNIRSAFTRFLVTGEPGFHS
jgi:hypothetical protein